MNGVVEIWLLIVGRILMGGLFVTAGLQHFFDFDLLTRQLAERRVPLPQLILVIGTGFQIVAGLGLMFGFYVLASSLGLVAFTLVASILMLNFWDLKGEPRKTARQIWQTNIAIMGGLLISAAYAT
ncbi:quinol oxidase [Kaistia algarum]|uniref:DoxX family protein n=1 Tax=Kaistia algarum TaxID=2083279 RepID=UPI000CE79258|nr:DoxX family protein [Kaistia algarum]MCX5512532.1 DoxX family protein [Kaistia algarum]PPE81939.1 quinol oxidase [Kaistia algarum]